VVTKRGGARLVTATACATAAVLFGTGAVRAAGPTVTVAPNPVASRQQTAVYGSGFCGSSGCSSVTVTLAPYSVPARVCGPVQRTLAVDVQVQSDGRFGVSFTVLEGSGQYCITATQTVAGGSTSSATTGMTVAAADYAPGAVPSTLPPGAPTPHPPPPAPQASPSASPGPPGFSPIASASPPGPPGPSSPAPVGTSPTGIGAGKAAAPWWWWALAAAVVAALAGAVLVVIRRRSGGGAPPSSGGPAPH